METCVMPHTVRKITVFFLLLLTTGSCIPVTKYTSSIGGCPNAFVAGDRILIGEAAGISGNQSYLLYEKLSPQLTEAGLQPAYAVEQEIYLRMQGIKPDMATDTSNLTKMQQLGYTYYLKPSIGNVASGAAYTYSSADDVRQMQQNNMPENTEETRAALRYDVYATSTKKLVYTLVTTTEMIGISLPNNDRENGYSGKTTVNASTVPMALNKALKKGTKKLLENCNCCR